MGAYSNGDSGVMFWLVLFGIIGRLGNGSPEIAGGAASVHDQDCGSGMSIVQAMLEDISKAAGIMGGLPSSFTLGVLPPNDVIVGPVDGGIGAAALAGTREEDGPLLIEAFGCDFAEFPVNFSSDSITGSFWPRSFPRLATPTPHVNVVLYPEHSRPRSRHWEQYGRRRSHRAPRLEQAKQSSGAPLTTVLLRRFRTGAFGSVLRDFPLGAGSFAGRSALSEAEAILDGRGQCPHGVHSFRT